MCNQATNYNLVVSVLAAAHRTCIKAEWDAKKAIRLLDAHAREKQPDMNVETYRLLYTAFRWMCGTKAEFSYEGMIDQMMTMLLEVMDE